MVHFLIFISIDYPKSVIMLMKIFKHYLFLDLKKELIDLFISKKFKGIDRVVPIGNAFQMNLVWDGYDVIKHMSRIIS